MDKEVNQVYRSQPFIDYSPSTGVSICLPSYLQQHNTDSCLYSWYRREEEGSIQTGYQVVLNLLRFSQNLLFTAPNICTWFILINVLWLVVCQFLCFTKIWQLDWASCYLYGLGRCQLVWVSVLVKITVLGERTCNFCFSSPGNATCHFQIPLLCWLAQL